MAIRDARQEPGATDIDCVFLGAPKKPGLVDAGIMSPGSIMMLDVGDTRSAYILCAHVHGDEWLCYPGTPDAEGELLRTGRVIGMLERVLLFLILVQGEWAAVGFVIAAKSVVRFPELNKRDFAEYYLLGTLASFLFAILSVLLYEQWLRWLTHA